MHLYHMVECATFIKSQLASRDELEGLPLEARKGRILNVGLYDLYGICHEALLLRRARDQNASLAQSLSLSIYR